MTEPSFPIPVWLVQSAMRDEEKWRYALLRYQCERAGGAYRGGGDAYFRDFGIGRYAVESALHPFIERGLIQVEVTGTFHVATLLDTRTWTVRIVEPHPCLHRPSGSS